MGKPVLTYPKEGDMKQSFRGMLTSGRLARQLGVDPKTLRRWAKRGKVPCYRNAANNYRYYVKSDVVNALGLDKSELQDLLDLIDRGN